MEDFIILSSAQVHEFEPADLLIFRYAIPGLLGNVEMEEVVARVLFYSVDQKCWVAVSQFRLFFDFQTEYMTLRNNEVLLERYYIARHKWMFWNRATLGIYQLFAKEPKRPEQNQIPCSHAIYEHEGTEGLRSALSICLEQGWLASTEDSQHIRPTVTLTDKLAGTNFVKHYYPDPE